MFHYKNDMFLMPETSANKRLEVYKCTEFPNKWELYTTSFEREMVFDAHFYFDNNDKMWLFINKMNSPYTASNSELYIYLVDSPKLDKIISHKQNPVVINSEIGRNAGSIFRYKNNIYRPSQYNAYSIYGKGININLIKNLTIEKYEEEAVKLIETNKKHKFRYLHHLHQTENKYVIDVCFKP